ncbi:MAG: O-acetylhomoserine aminocarboxypropyltransferase/cysteine synthase [Firmicutes bacterium]|nr:O-acetylhomoserine aminocarboxypropyltransferase/cysteine synthase [Bacillota bacterium]
MRRKEMFDKKYSLETACVQGGYQPKAGEPRILPIYQSTTFKYDTADQVADLFDLAAEGHMYSRISNPTVEALEKKVATLEGGIGALAVSSGQAASLLSVLTLASSGDHIIAMNNLYGGTHTLFDSTLRKFGIETSFVPLNDPEALERAIRDETKLIFAETLANPGVEVLDIERVASLAHARDLPLIVDNTFPTPFLCQPFRFGADIVVHSSTKYLDGHATSIGGIIVDSGRFDWTRGKFDCLTDSDPAYHGLSYTETFGQAAYLTKARAVYLRDLGTTMSPFNAWLTNLGTETLALRMERHSENALTIAQALEKDPHIESVSYPLLDSSPYKNLADKYLTKGGSGVIALRIKGGFDETKAWINRLRLASLVVHVGDLRTHVLHPASMTHRQLSEEALRAAGIAPNQVRLSVGLEGVDDLLEDLTQAFQA